MKFAIYLLLFVPFVSIGQTDLIDSIAAARINHEEENPVHSILLYVEKVDQKVIYEKGFGKLDKDLKNASKNNQFRIASTTKLFIATLVLQLEEEGKLKLQDPISSYLKDIDYLHFDKLHLFEGQRYSNDITIEQLLSHRSGLADIFTDQAEAFFEYVMQDPSRQYSPKTIVDLYYHLDLNRQPHFQPDQGWHYSDMNYVLAGLIIEHIEKTSLSESLRNRIFDPLKMQDTYFEFYEANQQELDRVNQYFQDINFNQINTSFDWSGGGLVSTNQDLATFIKSLFNLELIGKKSLNKMMAVKFTKPQENKYGLGIDESTYNGSTYFGHYGFYNTYLGYSPETKTVISYCISQSQPNFRTYDFINEVLKRIE